MAVVYNPNDPNAPKKQNDSEQQPGQPLQTIGTATPAAPSAGGGNKVSAPAASQPQGSGRFTNIQKYINANRSGGQKIADNIQNQFQKQTTPLGANIQQSQNRLNMNTTDLNQKLGEQGSQVLTGSFQDPQAILANQAKLVQAQNMQKGLAQNISNVDGVETLRQQHLQGQLDQAQRTAGLANTEQGRFQLLRNMLGKGSHGGYSQGAQGLDQVLLQSQPSVAQNLQSGLNNAIKPNAQDLSQLQDSRIQSVNDLRGLSSERQSQWSGLLNDGVLAGEIPEESLNQRGLTDMERSTEARLKQAESERDTLVPRLRDGLTANNLTSAELQRLGLSPGMQLYDVDPNSFMSQTDYNPDVHNTADINEVKRYRALRQLASMGDGGMFDANSEAKAGTYKPFEYNKQALSDAVAASKKKYEVDRVNDLVQQLGSQGFLHDDTKVKFGSNGFSSNAGQWESYDARLGQTFNDIKSQYDQGVIKPDEYYQRLYSGMRDVWGNHMDSFGSASNSLGSFVNYGKELDKHRNRALNPTDGSPARYGSVYDLIKPTTVTPKLGAEVPLSNSIDPKSLSK